MKKWTVTFEALDDGSIGVSSENRGFNSFELLALLDLKKCDLLAQLSPETRFKRVLIDEDGSEFEIKEEN
jgi:hypothetical protein